MREVAVEHQDPVHDQARLGNHNSEHAPCSEASEVDMLQRMNLGGGCQRYAHAARNQCKHMRCALKKLLAAVDSKKTVLNLLAPFLRQGRQPRNSAQLL